MNSNSDLFSTLPPSDHILLKLQITQMRLLDLLSDAEETENLDQYLKVVRNAELQSINALESINSLKETNFSHPELPKMITDFKDIRESLRRMIEYFDKNRAKKK